MATDRPTFDENWYRVASLRPRLRSVVQTHRQHERGRHWQVLRDPGNNQSYRLDDDAWYFVSLLDGRRSVAEVWQQANTHLRDRAPTQGEAIRLLGDLYTRNLLHGEMSPDAVGMFERMRRRRQREVGSTLMNVLFLRVPLLDPDRFLTALLPLAGWFFGPVGLLLWLAVMVYAALGLMGQSDRLFDQAQGLLTAGNLVYLYLCFVVIKLIHETGHGIACRRLGRHEPGGGEIHTLGVMLLVFTPVPYVDASSAWTFRSRWHRVAVGAAGMYVELLVAALAALIWVRTADGHLINALAYNLMFIGSVSTILFNANPLLRFDGYYILSDLLAMPNLNQRSKQYLYYLVRRYVFGVRQPENPARDRREKVTFACFALAAFVYRFFLCVVILLFVAQSFLFVGMILALLALIAWVITPLVKLGYYLLTSPELARTRPRALLACTLSTAGLLALTGWWPLPHGAWAPGIAVASEQVSVYTATSGKLVEVLASATPVAPGAVVLVRLENPQLLAQRDHLQARLDERMVLYRQSMLTSPAEAQAHMAHVHALEAQWQRVAQEIAALQVTSPLQGTWLTLDMDQRQGALLERGQAVGLVATLDRMQVRVAADQWSGPRLQAEVDPEAPVDIRVDGWPDAQYTGHIVRFAPAARSELPASALAQQAGGRLRDNDDERLLLIDIAVQPSEDQAMLLPGQRVVVRFALPDQPLLVQLWRYTRQLLQQRLAW